MDIQPQLTYTKVTKSHRKLSRAGYTLLSAFLAIILLIIIVWWPLVEEYVGYFNPAYPIWRQLDWLLIGIFLFMSVMIMLKADLKVDAWIVLVGVFGGLSIESWGTQTQLWTYFTNERPPLWIIPAWPIASLAIDRIYRYLDRMTRNLPGKFFSVLYWIIFICFLLLMVSFVRPTLDKSLTWLALAICLLLTFSRNNQRKNVLLFIAGAGLGYFLERWGTTRECWTYYTRQTPPLFAVLAHGLASVAFFRVMDIALDLARTLKARHPWLSGFPLPEKEPHSSNLTIPPAG
jgi:cell division protein FtsW (lipid II flippase)